MEHGRSARAADLADLIRLWDEAVGELDGQRGGPLLAGSLTRPELEQWLESALADPERLLVLGSIDEVPVGLASVRCERSRREPIGDLELIYVEPRARQVGVAEAMLEVVLPWCQERGCVGVDAPALPGSRATKSFFEDHGFMARLLLMHRSLPPEAEATSET